MDRLKVGIIGLGNMGKNHVRILSNLSTCCLVGCYDANQTTTNDLANKYGFQACTNISDLLKNVDAVVVAVPTQYHFQVGKECLEAGVHVLMEKPMCKTIEEAVELKAIADSKQLVLQIGHIERFNPAIQEFRKLFDPKQVISFWTERLSSFDPRIGDADVVEDLMIHDIDLMSYLFPYPIERIVAVGNNVHTNHTDHCFASIEFVNGVVANLCASRTTENKIRKLRVSQSKAYLEVDLIQRTIDVFTRNQVDFSETLGLSSAFRQENTVQRVSVVNEEPLNLEDRAFIEAVAGRDINLIPPEAGIAAMQIVKTIQSQIHRGNIGPMRLLPRNDTEKKLAVNVKGGSSDESISSLQEEQRYYGLSESHFGSFA